MSRFALTAAILAVAFASSCSNSGANYEPVIDGPVGPNYNADLAQCQQLAASRPAVDESTATAAATGAGIAAITSAIVSGGDNLAEAAAVGAIGGLTSNAFRKNAQREAIVRNCMRERGYNVIG